MGYVYTQNGKPTLMMKYYVNGRMVRESTGTTNRKKALKILQATETDKDRGLPVGAAIGKIKWEAAVALYEADYRNNNRKTLKGQQRRLRLHLTPFFGGRKMASIRPADITTYIDGRRADGAKVGTVNRELDVLRHMFVLCVKGERLLFRPHVERLTGEHPRAGFFDEESFLAVRRNLPADLQPVVTFAYVTGWRIDSEVLTRQWRHVDLAANEVRLDPNETKNKRPRVFRLTADLRAMLLERQAARDAAVVDGHLCPWVFFRMVAKGRGGRKYPKVIKRFQKAWRAACAAAGVPGRLPHDFRRSAVRNMVRRDVPDKVAMALAGHLTRSVFDRYNIVSESDLVTAAGRLEGLAPTETGIPTGIPPADSLTASRKQGQKVRKIGGAARV
jgi:integrase